MFYSEQDYQLCSHFLKKLAEQFGCAVHAYVLMINFCSRRSDLKAQYQGLAYGYAPPRRSLING